MFKQKSQIELKNKKEFVFIFIFGGLENGRWQKNFFNLDGSSTLTFSFFLFLSREH
jgi:hypothetical protein